MKYVDLITSLQKLIHHPGKPTKHAHFHRFYSSVGHRKKSTQPGDAGRNGQAEVRPQEAGVDIIFQDACRD